MPATETPTSKLEAVKAQLETARAELKQVQFAVFEARRSSEKPPTPEDEQWARQRTAELEGTIATLTLRISEIENAIDAEHVEELERTLVELDNVATAARRRYDEAIAAAHEAARRINAIGAEREAAAHSLDVCQHRILKRKRVPVRAGLDWQADGQLTATSLDFIFATARKNTRSKQRSFTLHFEVVFASPDLYEAIQRHIDAGGDVEDLERRSHALPEFAT